jgi:hypothetical protein
LTVLVVIFLGAALVFLCAGCGTLSDGPRGQLIAMLFIGILIVFGVVVFLRIYVPHGLSGPLPMSKDVEYADSIIERPKRLPPTKKTRRSADQISTGA